MNFSDFLEENMKIVHVKWAMMKKSNVYEVMKELNAVGGKNVYCHEESIVKSDTLEEVCEVYVVECDILALYWNVFVDEFKLHLIRGYWM